MTTLKIEKSILEKNVKEDHVQFLPFSVKFNGETEVESRFSSQTTFDKDKHCLVNSFRGYPLEGERLKIDENYRGVVIDTGRPSITAKENVRAVCTFDSLTFWNYDKIPGENDNYQQALQWMKVSEALHAPAEES